MRKLLFIILLNLVSLFASAQGTCFRSTDFPGTPRIRCKAETVGHKGYLMLGVVGGGIRINEVWEYDELTALWTQKNDFPGTSRFDAFTFSLNGNIRLQQIAGCRLQIFREPTPTNMQISLTMERDILLLGGSLV